MKISIHYLVTTTEDGFSIELFGDAKGANAARRRFVFTTWAGKEQLPGWIHLDDDTAADALWQELTNRVGFFDEIWTGNVQLSMPYMLDARALPHSLVPGWWRRFQFGGGIAAKWREFVARGCGWRIDRDKWWTRAPEIGDLDITESALGFYQPFDNDEGLAGPYVRSPAIALRYDRACRDFAERYTEGLPRDEGPPFVPFDCA